MCYIILLRTIRPRSVFCGDSIVYFSSFHHVQYVPGSTDHYRNDRLGNKKYECKESILNSEQEFFIISIIIIILFSSPKAADIFTVRVLTTAPAVPIYCAEGQPSHIATILYNIML